MIKCIWFYLSQYYFHNFLNSDSESHPVILIIRHQHFVKCFISFMAEINQKLKFICKTATHFTMRIVMSLIENPMSVKSVMVAWEWEWSISMHRVNEAHLIWISKQELSFEERVNHCWHFGQAFLHSFTSWDLTHLKY